MIWFLFLPLTPYLLWLLWAAAVHPIPLSYNWRSIWQRWAGTLSTVGAIAIVVLFAVFGVRGLRAAFRTQDPFARLLAFGITTTILLQAFFNISVVLSLVPTKGIPLPLISSGGTSVFVTLASIGILLSITRTAE